MNVAEWLNAIGLGQYEALFREHEIDAEVLPDLTEADVEKIGVPLGHRKRLIKAITKLGNAAPEQPEVPPPRPTDHSAPSRAFRSDAERRPITVMFCDLVGSTALASRFDAEDWRSLVNAYLDEASAAVTGLGGHVLKKLGDGLMALFGYPQAQENDTERAVRAALAIQRALSEINARNASKGGVPELSVRIELEESGPVVIETGGEVFGDAPNIAARVQAAADPELGSRHQECSAPSRGALRCRGARPARAQGPTRAGQPLSRGSRKRRRSPERRPNAGAFCRSR